MMLRKLSQIALLVVLATAPKYYGQARPNVYGGYNFYNSSRQVVGSTRPDMRGGYRYYNSAKTYEGFSRGGNGATYLPPSK